MTWDKFVKEPPFVGMVQFETSTLCNGRCVFCHHKDMTSHGVAPWSTILEVIDICVPYARTVCPFLMQEPLLEPRLCAVLDNIKQVNPFTKTLIYTNMAKLPDNWRNIIDEQNLDDMIISFYGPTAKLYKKYQPAFNWHQTRDNICRFMGYRRAQGKTKPFVKMHYITLPDLLGKDGELARSFGREWQHVVDAVGGTIYRTYEEDDPCFNSLSDAEEFELKVYGEPPPARVPCYRPWGGIYILFNGDVVPCSADYDGRNVLGNVLETDPRKIWLNEKYQAFRQKHIDAEYDDLPLCRYCNYWKYEMPPEWVNYWLENRKQVSLATA